MSQTEPQWAYTRRGQERHERLEMRGVVGEAWVWVSRLGVSQIKSSDRQDVYATVEMVKRGPRSGYWVSDLTGISSPSRYDHWGPWLTASGKRKWISSRSSTWCLTCLLRRTALMLFLCFCDIAPVLELCCVACHFFRLEFLSLLFCSFIIMTLHLDLLWSRLTLIMSLILSSTRHRFFKLSLVTTVRC